jgi:hypothetical protein
MTRLCWLAAFALATGGCDFATTAENEATVPRPSAPLAEARLNVFVLPSPIVALRDARNPSSRVARWTVQVFETAGVGGALTFVNATLRDADTGALVDPGFLSMDAALIRARAGTDRIAANGNLALAQSLDYESAGSGARLAVAVQFLDDHGNVVGGSVTARVQ